MNKIERDFYSFFAARKLIVFIAVLFLFLYSIILTLSPVIKLRSWDVNLRYSHWFGFLAWALGFFSLHYFFEKYLTKHDPLIVSIIGLLNGWGILSIFRLSSFFGFRQSIWFLLSVYISKIILKNKVKLLELKNYKYLILVSGLILLGLTFFLGSYPSGEGPRLWLGWQGVYFQPSELLKLLLILFLAAYFSDNIFERRFNINIIFPTLILTFIAIFLLIGQKDLGTAVIFIIIYISMLFCVYQKKVILLIGFLTLFFSAIIGYLTIDLVKIRLDSWILPWLNPQTSSYQIIQSTIAIASGGLLGTGVGIGNPGFIPIAHSDFIYSAITEENGLFGAVGLIILFIVLLYRMMDISIHTESSFGRYVAAGITVWIIAQTILIMGGNIRLFPITGVTLPFVSYGGSSLVVSVVSIVLVSLVKDASEKESLELKGTHPLTTITLLLTWGLVIIAFTTGWWSVIRSDDLQMREDNPRHILTSQYVNRGTILDRNGEPVAVTIGDVGAFERFYTYPPLSNTIGYIHPKYGITGLEKYYDDYLSGFRGYPAFNIWFNFLLYDQPPPGRDIRLTIDLKLQKEIDQLISNFSGCAVVMNANNGEILSISSNPFFDSNELEQNFNIWINDEEAPFINRVAQGAYPMSELISPFIIANLKTQELPSFNSTIRFRPKENVSECSIGNINTESWGDAVKRGCTTVLLQLIGGGDSEIILNAIDIFSLLTTPNIGISPIEQQYPQDLNWRKLIYGDKPIRTSPLRIATAISAFSNSGFEIHPQIASAVNTYNQGWIIVSEINKKQIINPQTANFISKLLKSIDKPYWEISTRGVENDQISSWYVAGTTEEWKGTPFVMVLVLENVEPEIAQSIGRKIFNLVLSY